VNRSLKVVKYFSESFKAKDILLLSSRGGDQLAMGVACPVTSRIFSIFCLLNSCHKQLEDCLGNTDSPLFFLSIFKNVFNVQLRICLCLQQ
jgi:hypothetical protein